MKKLLIFTLIALFALSAFSCNTQPPKPSETTDGEITTDEITMGGELTTDETTDSPMLGLTVISISSPVETFSENAPTQERYEFPNYYITISEEEGNALIIDTDVSAQPGIGHYIRGFLFDSMWELYETLAITGISDSMLKRVKFDLAYLRYTTVPLLNVNRLYVPRTPDPYLSDFNPRWTGDEYSATLYFDEEAHADTDSAMFAFLNEDSYNRMYEKESSDYIYKLECETKTLHVFERCDNENQDGSDSGDVTYDISIFGTQYGEYFFYELHNLKERPDIEWLSEFGISPFDYVDPSVETN